MHTKWMGVLLATLLVAGLTGCPSNPKPPDEDPVKYENASQLWTQHRSTGQFAPEAITLEFGDYFLISPVDGDVDQVPDMRYLLHLRARDKKSGEVSDQKFRHARVTYRTRSGEDHQVEFNENSIVRVDDDDDGRLTLDDQSQVFLYLSTIAGFVWVECAPWYYYPQRRPESYVSLPRFDCAPPPAWIGVLKEVPYQVQQVQEEPKAALQSSFLGFDPRWRLGDSTSSRVTRIKVEYGFGAGPTSLEEFVFFYVDSDGDGYSDEYELEEDTDPDDPNDHPDSEPPVEPLRAGIDLNRNIFSVGDQVIATVGFDGGKGPFDLNIQFPGSVHISAEVEFQNGVAQIRNVVKQPSGADISISWVSARNFRVGHTLESDTGGEYLPVRFKVTSVDNPVGVEVSDDIRVNALPVRVNVPNLVGETRSDATTMLTDAGLQLGQVTEKHDSSMPKGLVISHNPSAGVSVNLGSSVNLVISKGPEPPNKVTVPSVVGLQEMTAIATLENANLKVGEVTRVYNSTVHAGVVMAQDPSAGNQVDPGSEVDLVISKGAQPSLIAEILKPLSGQEFTLGDTVQFEAAQAGSGATYQWRIAIGGTTVQTINGRTATWTPIQTGNYSVTLKVAVGGQEATDSVDFKVVSRPVLSLNLEVLNDADRIFVIGDEIQVRATVVNGTGPFNVRVLWPNATLNISSGAGRVYEFAQIASSDTQSKAAYTKWLSSYIEWESGGIGVKAGDFDLESSYVGWKMTSDGFLPILARVTDSTGATASAEVFIRIDRE